MHVMVEQFGQGILLKHDLTTRQVQVQLARTGDIVILPGSQITLHVQHRVLSFEDFLMEEMQRQEMEEKQKANTAFSAGNGGLGDRPIVAKRDRGADCYDGNGQDMNCSNMTYSNCRPNGPNNRN